MVEEKHSAQVAGGYRLAEKIHSLAALQYRRSNPDLNQAEWQIAAAVARRVLDWSLPEESAIAALVFPVLYYNLHNPLDLAVQLGDRPILYAKRLLTWRETSKKSQSASDPSDMSFRLRSLLRQFYLDYDDLQFPLFLIAYHFELLNFYEDPSLARESLSLFTPLMEILGLWDLREELLKKSVPLAIEGDGDQKSSYAAICEKVEKNLWGCGSELKSLIRRSGQTVQHKEPGSKKDTWLADNRNKIQKAHAYVSLKKTLIKKLRAAGIRPLPKIQIRLHTPGDLFSRQESGEFLLNRSRPGESIEKILNHLWVRILCAKEEECYLVMGILHSLGKPIDPRFSERFDDYIAAPQPNGYQALHTALVFRPGDYDQDYSGQKDVQVEARLTTHKMHAINRKGVLEAFYKRPEVFRRDASYKSTWWSEKQIQKLGQRIDRGAEDRDPIRTFHDYLEKYPLDGKETPEVVYVFTPKGQVVIMEKGSTALDFAYQIHTELGNHATRIEVNRQPVSFSYRLVHGDMVQVYYDWRSARPDFTWLNMVFTAKARRIIRSELSQTISDLHEGPALIQQALAKTIQYYRKEKGYDLNITAHRLESFLKVYGEFRGFSKPYQLYEAVKPVKKKSYELTASQIVQRLVSSELASLLITRENKPLDYPLHSISLCEGCRPVPGEAIIGIEHTNRKNKRLTVHQERCKLLKGGKRSIPLRWAQTLENESLYELQIQAQDRPQVLLEILQRVHEVHGCLLHQADAQTFLDGSAAISLVISNHDVNAVQALCLDIEKKVPGVSRVQPNPVSPSQSAVFLANPSKMISQKNPYFENQVFKPGDFYGRQEQSHAVTTWLEQEKSGNWMILHGQRRVGKTSFAFYLANTLPSIKRLAIPVYIDMRGYTRASAEGLASFLLYEIFNILKQPAPARLPGEEATTWLSRGIGAAAAAKRKIPLLIILDELDTLIDREQAGTLDPELFPSFISVLNRQLPARWLIILREAVFQDTLPSSVIPLRRGAYAVGIDQLDEDSARRVIWEPGVKEGISFSHPDPSQAKRTSRLVGQKVKLSEVWKDHPLVDTIFHLSGGIPFYSKRICFHMVNRAYLQNRSNLTLADLEGARRDILEEGEDIFNHFLYDRDRIGRTVLDGIAALTDFDESREWIQENDLSAWLEQEGIALEKADLLAMLERLKRRNIIQTEQGLEGHCVRIPVQIFAEWLQEQLLIRYLQR